MLRYVLMTTALLLVTGNTIAMADTIKQFNITEPFGGPFAFIEGMGNTDNALEVDVAGSLTIDVTSGQIQSSAVTATNVAGGSPSTFSTIHSVSSDSTNTGIDVTLWDAFNLDGIILGHLNDIACRIRGWRDRRFLWLGYGREQRRLRHSLLFSRSRATCSSADRPHDPASGGTTALCNRPWGDGSVRLAKEAEDRFRSRGCLIIKTPDRTSERPPRGGLLYMRLCCGA